MSATTRLRPRCLAAYKASSERSNIAFDDSDGPREVVMPMLAVTVMVCAPSWTGNAPSAMNLRSDLSP